jgi:glycosyltransferase involved in cell wall biosynthesis
MKVLFFCKRFYTKKDLIQDRYGRLFELPVGLRSCGHEIVVVTTSYRPCNCVDRDDGGVRWLGLNLLPLPWRVLGAVEALAREFKPDVVLASSDAPHLIVGNWIASRLGVPAVLDLYDDYEAFGLTRALALRTALRKSCSGAAALVTVSSTLAELIHERSGRRQHVHVIGNGVPDDFVPPIERFAAREALGLPLDAPLIGTAGALFAQRGIDDLFEAFELVRQEIPAARLVVAGPRDRYVQRKMPRGTIDLGRLPHERIGLLLRALDVGVVCNRPGPFAYACHPMKLVEMAACGLPAIAADIGEVSRLLADRPDALYPPGDSAILADRIVHTLTAPRPLDARLARGWRDLSSQLSSVLEDAVRQLSTPE